MTIGNNRDNLARALLENWGRWAWSDHERRLDYSKQPIFRYYQAPGGEKRMPSKPISEIDAMIANTAILHIRIKEFPMDDVPKGIHTTYGFIVEKWAGGYSNVVLAEHYKCTTRTIRRKAEAARDWFMDEYSAILEDMRKVNAKYA